MRVWGVGSGNVGRPCKRGESDSVVWSSVGEVCSVVWRERGIQLCWNDTNAAGVFLSTLANKRVQEGEKALARQTAGSE